MKLFEIADTDADTDMQLFDTADKDADTDMNFLKNRGHGADKFKALKLRVKNWV